MILLADNEGPDESAWICRLILAFALSICSKTRFRMVWPIYTVNARYNDTVVAPAIAGQLRRASFRPSVRPSVNIYPGCLVSSTPLTVCNNHFEALHVFLWYEDVHVVGIYNCWITFCHFFHIVNLVIFHSIYCEWVPREHKTSYNFTPIFLKLCTCIFHSLEMCMCF